MLVLLLSIALGGLLEVFGGLLSYFAKTENAPFQIYAIILYVVGGVIIVAGLIDYIITLRRRLRRGNNKPAPKFEVGKQKSGGKTPTKRKNMR